MKGGFQFKEELHNRIGRLVNKQVICRKCKRGQELLLQKPKVMGGREIQLKKTQRESEIKDIFAVVGASNMVV